ncbi:hypothetical protein F2Q70_00033432 [Brassica cretica]|uniref:Glutamyl-tRNA(Gln) amidotransferase subunit C, chloroplastic/mitochondrial n=1 Tax=Brassica cretica TaxID=69181 RepID=A0A8S9FHJ0_BRACR|nr:hypothetical protein F2Q70_00033432 [Brassica cretica]
MAATRALLAAISACPRRRIGIKSSTFSSSLQFQRQEGRIIARSFSSYTSSSSLPDISRLAETARISLTPAEIEECEPKIRQVIDWFGQLQQVDVNCVEPAIRAGLNHTLIFITQLPSLLLLFGLFCGCVFK